MNKFLPTILLIFIIGCSNDGQPSKPILPKENFTLECQAAGRRILIYITKGSKDITTIENGKSYDYPNRLQILDKFYLIEPEGFWFGGNSETWKINRTTLIFQLQISDKTYDGKCDIVDKPRL
jgi:hypothetical protein